MNKQLIFQIMLFLQTCNTSGENYEGVYYDKDSDTNIYIFDIAEKLLIVKNTGNYQWQLSEEFKAKLADVYFEYTKMILDEV